MTTSRKFGPSISASWSKVSGANAYSVTSYPPTQSGTQIVRSPKATLTGLTSGIPYLLSIKAIKTNRRGTVTGGSLASTALSFSGSTSYLPPQGPYSFQFGLSWALSSPENYIVKVAGQTVTYNATIHQWSNVSLTASPGDNYYPIIVVSKNAPNTLLYANAFKISAGNADFFQLLSPPSMPGDTNMTVAYSGGNLKSFPNTNPLAGLVITTSAQPVTRKIVTNISFPKNRRKQ